MRLSEITKEPPEDVKRFLTLAHSDKSKLSMIRIHKKVWPEPSNGAEITDASRYVYCKQLFTNCREWVVQNLGTGQEQIELYRENLNRIEGWIKTFEEQGKINNGTCLGYVKESGRIHEKIIELEAKLNSTSNAKGIWDDCLDEEFKRVIFSVKMSPSNLLLPTTDEHLVDEFNEPQFSPRYLLMEVESLDGKTEFLGQPNLDENYDVEVFIKPKIVE